MVHRIIGMCVLILILPVAVMAQTTPKTLDELAKEVESLQTQLKTANETLTRLAVQVAENTRASTKNAEGITGLAGQMNQELTKQQAILEQIDELAQQQQEQLARQQEILDAIAQKDSNGNDMLRLSANMEKSDEFRQDVRKAVHESLDTQGEVTIHNRMASVQRISVNQKEHVIGAGEVLTLKVPVGTVTCQLPGQSLTNWTVACAEYAQKIDIVPDTNATVVYRPLYVEPTPPVYVAPAEPVYLNPLPTTTYYAPAVEWYAWPF